MVIVLLFEYGRKFRPRAKIERDYGARVFVLFIRGFEILIHFSPYNIMKTTHFREIFTRNGKCSCFRTYRFIWQEDRQRYLEEFEGE